jgi:hypothetical protein
VHRRACVQVLNPLCVLYSLCCCAQAGMRTTPSQRRCWATRLRCVGCGLPSPTLLPPSIGHWLRRAGRQTRVLLMPSVYLLQVIASVRGAVDNCHSLLHQAYFMLLLTVLHACYNTLQAVISGDPGHAAAHARTCGWHNATNGTVHTRACSIAARLGCKHGISLARSNNTRHSGEFVWSAVWNAVWSAV